jgi:alginate O-acetyltransferase complex protein AlgI
MLFNSYFFIFVFLPFVLVMWWCARLSTPQRLIALVVASYCFYGWWDYRFVGLLLFSSVVDYLVGQRLDVTRNNAVRRAWLLVSLSTNLGLLAYFKYCGFFAQSVNQILEWARTGESLPVPEIILPVGISFYTFQTLSYTIDIYRRQAKPADSFWHFAAYVSLFPQLIAGPIVRYTALESQLRCLKPRMDWQHFSRGILFFVAGLAQKVLLADMMAAKVNPLFATSSDLQCVASWFAMLGYTFQLYFDFAGYSNMAVGLGLMLGFSLPQNFDSPYKSVNISMFWRRWHISLSSWLRDYLFIPLGGSHGNSWFTLRNLFIVMFLGGLWHGAGWTFALWGVYHGILLISYRLATSRIRLPNFAAVAVTFLVVVFGWVLFRSTDISMCANLLQAMCGLRGIEPDILAACGGATGVAILTALAAIVFVAPNLWEIRWRLSYPLAMAVVMVFVLCVLRFDAESPFLYFQF